MHEGMEGTAVAVAAAAVGVGEYGHPVLQVVVVIVMVVVVVVAVVDVDIIKIIHLRENIVASEGHSLFGCAGEPIRAHTCLIVLTHRN